MELINNVGKTLRDDLIGQLQPGSRLSIVASCFSIYAFQELKEALKDIKELRFIFTSPTFTAEKTPKQQREFYIPRLDRERTLYGLEFEVKLRNELTQKAIARECAEWIREKVCFKSNQGRPRDYPPAADHAGEYYPRTRQQAATAHQRPEGQVSASHQRE